MLLINNKNYIDIKIIIIIKNIKKLLIIKIINSDIYLQLKNY